jgi:O-antigen/teichoic acid export membrane protein
LLSNKFGINNKTTAKKSLAAARQTVVFRPLTQVSSLAITILLVRTLSEKEFGVYGLLYSLISFLGVFASFGLVATLQRFLAEYFRRGEFIIANTLLRTASLIRLISNITLLGVLLLFWDLVAPLLKIAEYLDYYVLFIPIILLYMQNILLQNTLNSFFLHSYTQPMLFVFSIIKLTGYFCAYICGFDLWIILIVDIISYLIVTTSLQFIYWRKIPRKIGSLHKFNDIEKKRVMRYSFFCNFNDAGSSVLDANFDNIIIAMYLDPLAVGAYAFCLRISQAIYRFQPLNYLIDVVKPSFYSLDAKIGSEQINHIFQLMVKTNLMFTIPVFFGILVAGKDLILVFFAGKFLNQINVLNGILFFGILHSFALPIGLVAHRREKVNTLLYSKIFAFYNIFADIVLIKLFGIWGAVVATGTAVLGKNIFIWFFVRDEANFKGMWKYYLISVGYWVSVAGISLLASHYVILNSLRLSIVLTIFVAAFPIYTKLLVFSEMEKKFILSLLEDIRNQRIQRFLYVALR